MDLIENLKQRISAITYFIGQAQSDEERVELENKYNKELQDSLASLKILENTNGES